ncbi:isochorismatase family protein [Actinospica sp.]|jgi:nicotinamidase-related amidase/predicted MFS family arabinose efflux permease|uniref:isochorismatase family protein n=1 Tax=Actinospica sp. TaxID=1872142 RepID=UPI002BB427BA|nr:isochorismatase family protein [Actinospica sp.]HWG26588.1 isochorismatase family protein [Actinospica sp.]
MDEAWRQRPFSPRFVAPLLMGATLNPVNSSVIATALVAIAAAVGVPVGQTAVLISCLYLTSAIAQPTAGRLAEEFGPRRVFLAGIAIVLVGGVLGGVAVDLPMLIAARVLIGLGTSAGYPAAMLLIRRRATAIGLEAPPARVLSGLAIAGAVTVAIGPAVGGLLVGWFGWRAAFLVNVPFTVLAFAMATAWIAKDTDVIRGRSARDVLTRIDVLGVVCFGSAMTALLVFLLGLPTPRWAAIVLAVAFAVALVFWELRAVNPFIDVRLLASNAALTRTYLRNALSMLGIYVMLYGLTQWLEAAHGLSAYAAGLVLLPMGLLSAGAARAVANYINVRTPLIVAAVLLVLGSIASLFLTSGTPIVAIIGVTALFGLMSGISNLSNQTALYRVAPAEKLGTASGLLRTFGYVGSIASATITGIAFRTRVSDGGLHHVSLALIAIGAVVLLMTVFDRHLKPSAENPATHEENIRIMSVSTTQSVDPSRTALLLMDYQNAVLGALAQAEAVLENARQALEWARANDVQVVYVRVAFNDEDFEKVPAHSKTFAQVAANKFLLDGSPEAALHDSLEVRDGDILTRKTRFGAFSTTELYSDLHAKGLDTLVVAGISTSGVVLSTLRDAGDRDFRILVLADATADPDPEVHRVLIDKVFPHHADIVQTADLKALSAA